MINEDIKDIIAESLFDTENIILLDDNYADAFIGMTNGGSAVYGYYKMVASLAEKTGLSLDEAAEWIDYNTVRSIAYLPKDCTAPTIVYEITQQD